MVQLTGFHHTTAFSKDLQQTLSFYEETLGLRLVLNTVHQERHSIRHLFFGDQLGTPGTLLSFFLLPKAGRSYKENNYFSSIHLAIPANSSSYWEERMKAHGVTFHNSSYEKGLAIEDPDGLILHLIERDETIGEKQATSHSDVPAEKQIIRIIGAELYVEQPKQEETFLQDWLNFHTEQLSFSPKKSSFYIESHASTSTNPSRVGRGFIDHLAFGVSTTEELQQLKEHAHTLGYEVEMMKDREFFASLYVKDPFGMRYEIATTTPGFSVPEDPRKLLIPDHLKEKQEEITQNLGGDLHDKHNN